MRATMPPAQLWSNGDYAAAADRWAAASCDLARDYTRPGGTVLDVACGPGALAIAAAEMGARATGLDIAPALLDIARQRSEAAGVEVDWVEADMTELPFPQGSFDLVASAFGCMFAPDPEAMAAEMLRVCGPAGTIVTLAWTPDSPFGRFWPMTAPYLPGAVPETPIEHWSRPEQATALFAGRAAVTCTVLTVEPTWPTFEDAVHELCERNPAWLAIRSAVEPTGRWPQLLEEVRDHLATCGHTARDHFTVPVDYLRTVAAKP